MRFRNELRDMSSINSPGSSGENTRLLDAAQQPALTPITPSAPSYTSLRTQANGGYGANDAQQSHESQKSHQQPQHPEHSHHSEHCAPGGPSPPGTGSGAEGYEELFKDSVPCPSCRGLGRVPKELENQLVALIPMKDGRLKPRRTTLYVLLAIFVCLTIAGLLIFFLMPRDITISSNRPFLQPKHIEINVTARYANFTVINHYNVSNNNFYSVKISGVAMKSLYSNAVIAQSFAYKQHPLEISARSDKELSVPMDFVLSGEHGSLVSHCMSNWSWIHNLPILFEVTANYTYMGHSEQATLTTFQTVSCHPAPRPPPSTIKPRTTTGKTTTRSSRRKRTIEITIPSAS